MVDRITVRLDREHREKLEAIRHRTAKNFSNMIREALVLYFYNRESGIEEVEELLSSETFPT